jgi:uncharacterized protein YhaN
MIVFDSKSKKQLIDLFEQKRIGIEGNILKLIDVEGDAKFAEYIQNSVEKDKENRKKRLEITKQVQIQNKELEGSQKSLQESLDQIKVSMEETQASKDQAEKMRLEADLARAEAERAKEEAELAKEEAESAKSKVESDLDILQRRTQNELIGTIVKVALMVIVGVGFVTTGVYLLALFTDKNTEVIASTWANIVGILLTNAFSIVGTIMGVKYASEK